MAGKAAEASTRAGSPPISQRFMPVVASMARQDESLHRQEQGLYPQHESVDHADRVDDMEIEPPRRAHVLLRVENVMIVGVGIGDTVAARRHALEATLV